VVYLPIFQKEQKKESGRAMKMEVEEKLSEEEDDDDEGGGVEEEEEEEEREEEGEVFVAPQSSIVSKYASRMEKVHLLSIFLKDLGNDAWTVPGNTIRYYFTGTVLVRYPYTVVLFMVPSLPYI
jgi:hypothetical protein